MWPWQRARPAEPAETASPRWSPEWPSVPPIQRVTSAVNPVAPRDPFAASLVTWRDPSFLAPLGHVVSGQAPSGVIHRLIEPSGTPEVHPPGLPLALASRPVAPRPTGSVVQRLLSRVTGSPSEPVPPAAVAEATPEPAGEAAPAIPAVDAVDAVEPPVPVRPVQRAVSLTQAPPPPAMPVLQLAAVPGARMATEPTADVEPAEAPTLGTDLAPAATGLPDPIDADGAGGMEPAGTVPLPVAGPPVASSGTAGDGAPSLGTVQRSAPPATGSTRQEPAPPLGQTPLAPLVGHPRPTTVQRDIDHSPPRGSEPAIPVPPASPAPDVPAPTGPANPVDPPAFPRRLGLGAPIDPDALVLQRSAPELAAPRAAEVADPPLVTTSSPSPRPEPLEESGAVGTEPVRPLLGVPGPGTSPVPAEPLPTGRRPDSVAPGPLPTVQRSVSAGDGQVRAASPPAREATQPGTTTSPPPAPVQRADAGGPATARPDPLPPSASAAEPVAPLVGQLPAVQRAGASHHWAPPAGAAPIAPLTGSAPPFVHELDSSGVFGPQNPAGVEFMDGPSLAAVQRSSTADQPVAEPPAPEPAVRSAAGAAEPPPAPLVVARLVGDRTPLLFTGPGVAATPSTATPPVPGAGTPSWSAFDAPVAGTAGYVPATQASLATPPPLAIPPTPSPQAALQFVPSAPVVQTLPAGPVPVTQTVQVVQTAPEPVDAVPAPVTEATTPAPGPAGTPAGAPAGAPAPAGAATPPDELAKKLFEPLLRRLKAELRLDRERRGVLTDLRH